MAQTVIGIFDNTGEAQDAIKHLVNNGFSRNNIDVSAQSSTDTTTSTRESRDDDDSIGGFFRSLFGGNDDESKRYSTVARRGCVVTVHAQSNQEAERAADILDEYGAVDVNERATQYGYSGQTNTSTMDTTSTIDTDRDRFDTTSRTADADTSIPIIEENLNVGKRVVETGGVRLRSRIIERPVEESLRLREEHVHVERRPVNRPASEADLTTFQQGTIEMTEHAEVPVVNKESRVVEEVSLSKDVEEREEVIRDTLRSTDVEVENLTADRDYNRTTNESRSFDSDDTIDLDNRNRTRLDRDDDLNRPANL
jgi:uncharacterized protein (TIGR02271 family)